MPSIISHPAVTFALKPFFQQFDIPLWITVIGAICTIIPDFDVIGFAFGVEYGSVMGHRGITHSLFFAALVSASIVIFIKGSQQISKPWCFVFLFLCTASHGFFDALTSGGHGVAFFAPFYNERFFFPWQPIRVSPIGVQRFLSGRGLIVLASEFIWVWIPSLTIGLCGILWNRFSQQRSNTKR